MFAEASHKYIPQETQTCFWGSGLGGWEKKEEQRSNVAKPCNKRKRAAESESKTVVNSDTVTNESDSVTDV